AGLRYVPLPDVASYTDLLAVARRTGARYLFYSRQETDRAPVLLALLDPGGALPGLEPVERRMDDALHYFALYRLTGEAEPAAEGGPPAIDATRNCAAKPPGEPLPLTTLADELLAAHRPREALKVLAPVTHGDSAFAPGARFTALAYFQLGLVD